MAIGFSYCFFVFLHPVVGTAFLSDFDGFPEILLGFNLSPLVWTGLSKGHNSFQDEHHSVPLVGSIAFRIQCSASDCADHRYSIGSPQYICNIAFQLLLSCYFANGTIQSPLNRHLSPYSLPLISPNLPPKIRLGGPPVDYALRSNFLFVMSLDLRKSPISKYVSPREIRAVPFHVMEIDPFWKMKPLIKCFSASS